MLLISTCFVVSGCGKNYFKETAAIKISDKKYELNINRIYADKEPEFYQPDIFKEKEELYSIDRVEYPKILGYVRVDATSYGWIFTGKEFEDDKKDFNKKIVSDNEKEFFGNEKFQTFDKSNYLGYSSNEEGIVTCTKLTKQEAIESWRLQLPFKYNEICQRTMGNFLIVFGLKDIVLIDTKNVKVVKSYKLIQERFEIFQVIPEKNMLWVFCTDVQTTLGTRFYETGYWGIPVRDGNLPTKTYSIIFAVDTSDESPNTKIFEKFIYQAKASGNKIAVNDDKELFIIDENHNTQKYVLSDIHPGAKFEDIFHISRNRALETDCIGVVKDQKKYAFDIDNPQQLIELPDGLLNINTDLRGFGWDYCYKKEGYYYGYDIHTKETTWKFKSDGIYDLPIYSTDMGILTSNWYMDKQKFITTAYDKR